MKNPKVENKKRELAEATMRIAAETGLGCFSMKKVTERIGVSESLIYRHYETKENLLYYCFESVHRQVAALFDSMKPPKIENVNDLNRIAHQLWMMYFEFLVKNDYRTLYYFAYRESPFINVVRARDYEARDTYFKEFVLLFGIIEDKFQLRNKTNTLHFWTYVLDTSGIFACRIIRGQIPNTPESHDFVWQLISGGLFGLLRE